MDSIQNRYGYFVLLSFPFPDLPGLINDIDVVRSAFGPGEFQKKRIHRSRWDNRLCFAVERQSKLIKQAGTTGVSRTGIYGLIFRRKQGLGRPAVITLNLPVNPGGRQ